MKHKRRLERIEQQLPSGDDDEIIVIRLVWPEEDWQPPVILRCGADVEATIRWDDEITIIE